MSAPPPTPSPFGILEPLHRIGLSGAPLGSVSSWITYAALPLIPLYLQAYLLVGNTPHRPMRIALCVLHLALVWHGWTSYRFAAPKYNAFNNGFTIIFLHLAVKSLEFALLKNNVVDPYMQIGRPRWVAAQDICLNSRLVSLGSVGLDTSAGAPNETIREIKVERHLRHGKKHHHVHKVARANGSANGAANGIANGSAKQNGNGHGHGNGHSNGHDKANGSAVVHKHDSYVHHDLHRPKTRLGSMARHALHAFSRYVVIDTLFTFMQLVSPDILTVTLTEPTENLFDTFVSRTGFKLLPGVLDWDVPAPLFAFGTQCCIPVVIWMGLSGSYHAAALVAIGSGLWEVRAWDVDLFDAPWRADSLIDLWGKRWHQLFRHQFIILSAATLRVLHLPLTPLTLFPLTFFYSGALHALGELSMTPAPAPFALGSFFLLAGAGCAVEVVFKNLTGKRVRGRLGQLWVWSSMYAAGLVATNAWLDAGIAGCQLLPPGGVGTYVAPWLLSWAFEPYSRP